MHLSLSTNFSFRRFDLVLGPSLHRLPPQQPHLLHDPLLDRIGLLEVSLAVLYRPNYRREFDREDQGAPSAIPSFFRGPKCNWRLAF